MPYIPRNRAPFGGIPPELLAAVPRAPRGSTPSAPLRATPQQPEAQQAPPASLLGRLSIQKHEVSADSAYEQLFGKDSHDRSVVPTSSATRHFGTAAANHR
jgi:hypothetical protein